MSQKISAIIKLIDDCNIKRNPTVSEGTINKMKQILGCNLPDEYKSFLKCTNGGELKEDGISFFPFYCGSEANVPKKSLNYVNGPLYRRGSIPDTYLIIGRYCFGDEICINPENGHVLQWSREYNEVFFEQGSLVDYLKYLIKMHNGVLD